jgi:hypothetical protein
LARREAVNQLRRVSAAAAHHRHFYPHADPFDAPDPRFTWRGPDGACDIEASLSLHSDKKQQKSCPFLLYSPAPATTADPRQGREWNRLERCVT